MVKSLFSFLKKPKSSAEPLAELDISRVVGERKAPERPDPTPGPLKPAVNLETWKRRDLDLLQTSWQACCDEPDTEEHVSTFRSALHNLHGASGAYGGGALTRLTGSLHELVSRIEDIQADAALINLHVQACRAAGLADGEGADEVADAVCDALEDQVLTRLQA